jgi:hypothetical protein
MKTATEILELMQAIEKRATSLQAILDGREQLLMELLEGGNIPEYNISMTEVTVEEKGNKLRYQVSNDYLSFGTRGDAVRMPMLRKNVLPWMRKNKYLLPTRKMVNQIWDQAGAKVLFEGWGAPYDTQHMTMLERYWGHNKAINDRLGDEQLAALRNGDVLFAGGKKDIISSWVQKPDKIVIYGGPLEGGGVVQPLMGDHGWYWIDYSQCFRLVADRAFLNENEVSVEELLRDPAYSYLVNDECTSFTVLW